MHQHPNSRLIQYPYMVATEFAAVIGMTRVGARLMTVYELGLKEGGTRRAVYTLAAKKGYGGFENQALVYAVKRLQPEHGTVHVANTGFSDKEAAYFGSLVSFPDGIFCMEDDIAPWSEFMPPETRLLMAFPVQSIPKK